MAGNKFATMLHKNCHRTVVILIYAVLEWILILLLIFNSLFSYLISKFVKYFGLQPSCTWCTRLDHIFDSNTKEANSYRHLHHVCESHGAEISKLAYCTNHRRLAESINLCRDCSPGEGALEYGEDQSRRCSCCDEIVSRDNIGRPSFLFKPTWDVLDYYIQKKGSVAEVMDLETKSLSDKADQTNQEMKMQMQSDFTYESIDDPLSSLGCNEDDEDDDDESLYITDLLLRNSEYTDCDRFICIELIDTVNKESIEEEHEDKQVSSVEVHSGEADLVSSQMDEYKKQEEAEAEAEAEASEATGVEGLDNFEEKEVEEEEEKHTPEVMITDNLHNEMIKFEKVENNSFDGSVISEIEVVDESLMTTEHLKTTVKAQEKALNALYTELEEERKAAAEAANETMAMMTKLQEEKSAIQMEALQYQRMMEEQAEYDQEALQLLNDLMNRREKEKQQLEKELEMCRNKLSEYEMEIVRSRNGTGESNYNRSNCGDELFDDVGSDIHLQQNLGDISLEEFDEERLSILEELKGLEAKLFALHDDGAEMQLSENVVAKKLLPLFDNEEEMEKDRSGGAELQETEENNKVIMHEELVHVYERLQALEADKEFLKHCIRSMMKGNEGLPLLHEILQHLRDLRSVELLSEEIVSAENYSSSNCETEARSDFS